MLTLPSIAFRQLTTKHSYELISFTSFASIIGLILGVAALLLVDSFTNGFSSAIEGKLAAIDGHIRVTKFTSAIDEGINPGESAYLDSVFNTISQSSIKSPYITNNGFIKKNNTIESAYVYGIENSALLNIFNINQFITEGSEQFNNQHNIILGKKLADILNVKIGDKIHLLDIEPLIETGLFLPNNFNITGTITTGFPEYDQVLAFIPLRSAQKVFSYQNNVTGYIVNLDNINEIPDVVDYLNSSLYQYPFIVSSWEERHLTLIKWLQVYHVPIQLIIIFITIIAICNIGVNLWMMVLEKTREIGILRSFGFTKSMIRNMFIYQGIYIGIIGTTIGTLLGILISELQSKFQIISLSTDVYFMEQLNPVYNWNHLLMVMVITPLLTILMSLIPGWRASNIIPADALKYE